MALPQWKAPNSGRTCVRSAELLDPGCAFLPCLGIRGTDASEVPSTMSSRGAGKSHENACAQRAALQVADIG